MYMYTFLAIAMMAVFAGACGSNSSPNSGNASSGNNIPNNNSSNAPNSNSNNPNNSPNSSSNANSNGNTKTVRTLDGAWTIQTRVCDNVGFNVPGGSSIGSVAYVYNFDEASLTGSYSIRYSSGSTKTFTFSYIVSGTQITLQNFGAPSCKSSSGMVVPCGLNTQVGAASIVFDATYPTLSNPSLSLQNSSSGDALSCVIGTSSNSQMTLQ